MEYIIGILVLVGIFIWRVKRNAQNLQKMCWIFFQHYIHLGDEQAKHGFQHIYVVFADEMKNEFRAIVDFHMFGFETLMKETPKDEISLDQKMQDFAFKVRLRDCQDFAENNLSAPISQVRRSYQKTYDAYPDLAKAIKRSDLSFAKRHVPADFEIADYHGFLHAVKRPST